MIFLWLIVLLVNTTHAASPVKSPDIQWFYDARFSGFIQFCHWL